MRRPNHQPYQEIMDQLEAEREAEIRRQEIVEEFRQEKVPSGAYKYPETFAERPYRGAYRAQQALEARTREDKAASEDFYKHIGYPQYAGKFKPFPIPKGYRIETISETEKGIEVTFTETTPRTTPSIVESLFAWKPPDWWTGFQKQVAAWRGVEFIPHVPTPVPKEYAEKIEPEHPLSGLAGAIAPTESFIYGVARLAGVPTPEPPPTVVGGLVGKGIEAVTGIPSTELERAQKYGRSYATASILGDIALSMVIGEAVSKGITEPLQKAFKFSRAEKWLIRQSKWYRERAAREISKGIVSIPRMPEKVGMEWIKTAKAVDVAWELIQSPRTTGLLVTPAKVVAPKAVRRLPTLLAWVGAGVIEKLPPLEKAVKLRPLSEEMKKTPMSFEKYKWKMPVEKAGAFVKGKLPTLKDLLTETKGKATLVNLLTTPAKARPALKMLPAVLERVPPSLYGQILGTTIILGLRAIPKAAEIPIAKPKAKKRAVPRLAPIIITRPEAAEVAKARAKAIAAQREKAVQLEKQRTKQAQKLTQILFQPPALMPPDQRFPRIFTPRTQELLKRRRMQPSPFARWFFKRHPVPTGVEVIRRFAAPPRKRKRRRRVPMSKVGSYIMS